MKIILACFDTSIVWCYPRCVRYGLNPRQEATLIWKVVIECAKKNPREGRDYPKLDQLVTRVGSTVGAKRIVGEEVAHAMRSLSAPQRVDVELRTERSQNRILLVQHQPVAGQILAVGHHRTGALRTAVRQEVRGCYAAAADKPRNDMIQFDAIEPQPGATPPKVQRVARGTRPTPGRRATQRAGR